MIEVKNLVKKYDNHLAVDHLNFTLEKGKIYGFLGPNGAGKSTTMNIMTGYLGATEGDVLINGHSISNDAGEAKKYIGYLPEIPPLYTEMKVYEYIKFAAELKNITGAKQKEAIEEAIQTAKLDEVRNRLIKNLSKGYRQRVGLAQAVIGMPEIIILDEPTVGLDPKQIIEIRETIKELSKGRTIILSSHIMQEVSAVCDYIMIISKGKMVASDTPENLSKLLVGANTLELEVKCSQDRISTILDSMEDIQSIEYEKSSEEGTVFATITTAQDKDIREELFYILAENKCPIYQMELKRVSLEDVFLELTSDKNEEQEEEEEAC